MQENLMSISPAGEQFALPRREDYQAEFARLQELAAAQRQSGKEIVVVVGLGFVGAVMAAVVADSTDKKGRPGKFVIGVQRAEHAEFLEDSTAQPRRIAGQG